MEVTHTQDEATPSVVDANLTVSDVVRITRLSADTIRRYSNSGKLPTFRTPGNQRRFRDSDVRALLTPQATPSSDALSGVGDGVSFVSDEKRSA